MKTNALDALVNRLTAFRTWNEMATHMAKGYVPTLNGGRAYSKLADICRRNGFQVYRNGKVI
jgi:hypothetical protein